VTLFFRLIPPRPGSTTIFRREILSPAQQQNQHEQRLAGGGFPRGEFCAEK
jgi:hypothetical protein